MKKTIHDLSTGEIYEMNLTPEEIELANIEFQKYIQLEAEAKAKATQRQAILDRLGLTSEEASLLLS